MTATATESTPGMDEAIKEAAQKLKPRDYRFILDTHPDLRREVIIGLARVGEVINIIAASKVGKSFLAVYLAWCVALGYQWFGFRTRPLKTDSQGNEIPDNSRRKVLIIDDELHDETIGHRIDRVADALMIMQDDRKSLIDVITLRGEEIDILTLEAALIGIEKGHYALIVLDALYRLIPPNTSENDNAAMTRIYNRIDKYAAMTDSAIVVVHHSSKGDQNDKAMTDVGAGAGAISRAADTHVTIRPHAKDSYAVLEAVTRSFKSPEPLTIKFDYPLWSMADIAPEKQTRNSGQAEEDRKFQEIVLRELATGKLVQQTIIFSKLACGNEKKKRILAQLLASDQIQQHHKKKRGQKRTYVFYSMTKCSSESSSGFSSGPIPESEPESIM